MDPNLASAGAPAPTYTLEDYPLLLEQLPGPLRMEFWLDSLSRVTVQNTPDLQDRVCTCCNYPNTQQTPFEHLERPENWLLKLPCGCSYRRGCAFSMLKSRNDCLYCGFQIFKQWTLHGYVNELPTADLAKVRERGRDTECGICQMEFSDRQVYPEERPGFTLERPVTLPCSHLYGEKCLRTWLSPESKGGGNANTCPSCRKVLFPPWPTAHTWAHRERMADIGLSDDGGDDHDEDDSSVEEAEGEEDIASSHTAIPTRQPRGYTTSGGERTTLSRTVSQVTSNLRTRLQRRRPAASGEEPILSPPPAGRTRLIGNLSVPTPTAGFTGTSRGTTRTGEERVQQTPPAGRTQLVGSLFVPTPTAGFTGPSRGTTRTGEERIQPPAPAGRTQLFGSLFVPTPTGGHTAPSRAAGRTRQPLNSLDSDEGDNSYWGFFIDLYARVQDLDPSLQEDALEYMMQLVGCHDDRIGENSEERANRRESIKRAVYEEFGTPCRRGMDRLNAVMQDYENGQYA